MKKFTKKAFTLVELLVVIAILAVLSAVSIVGYNSFTKKANISNDQSLVAQLNTILEADEAYEGKKATPSEVLELVEDNGYVVEKLTPTTAKFNICYNSDSNRFFLLDDKDEVNFGSEANKAWNNWGFVSAKPTSGKMASYSWYLNKDFKTTETPFVVSAGLDVGENVISSIKYETTDEKSVVLRTSGQETELTVNGSSSTVNHYGYTRVTNVVAVDSSNCFNEYGTSTTLNATKGKIVVQNTGVVFNLAKTASSTATFENKGGNVLKAEANTLPESKTFVVNSYNQFVSFRDASNSGESFKGYTIELNCDIYLDEAWKPISNYWRKDSSKNGNCWFAGSFDGKNHTIYGLTNVGLKATDLLTGHNSTTHGDAEYLYGLFGCINGASIKNLNLSNVNIQKHNYDSGISTETIGALVGFVYGQGNQIEGINVTNSTIIATDVVGSIIGSIRGGARVYNCSSNATIISDFRAAGLIGTITYGDVQFSVEIEKCSFDGSVSSSDKTGPKTTQGHEAAGLFIYNNGTFLTIKVKNVKVKENCVNADSAYVQIANVYLDSTTGNKIVNNANISDASWVTLCSGNGTKDYKGA